jgi:hypothetical protein
VTADKYTRLDRQAHSPSGGLCEFNSTLAYVDSCGVLRDIVLEGPNATAKRQHIADPRRDELLFPIT